ncbi:hypothetical protein J2X48_005192 [Bosea sp. BE271]|jgi:hypothetical protein|uniref:hypothetical protein n=1 Tax=Bosea TaxID=85413 RepID=UPI0028633FB9|nr:MULTISPECIES: hypothetical protein [Bosea]MDR6831511.1 hypothetical protein [Bosea robiniae]MDR6898220.1 hypothetical protein [Bosea sp. BE109]MDR7141617.1 hypothetical protein [Bosea sp. BE168]MDR7178239.1 hypothetical protein [Bosea sp. BE271]
MADQNEFGQTGGDGQRSQMEAARAATGDVSENLKSVGIDTDRMTEAAGERVSELQSLLMAEIRAQPLRALAWAAAAGVIFGFWAAK